MGTVFISTQQGKRIKDMTHEEMVSQLFSADQSDTLNLLHGAVGIAGEAGELLDAIKKHWIYGKQLDVENVIEELGDLYFYFTALRIQLGVEMDQIIQANREKLDKRYPNGVFTQYHAAARLDKEQA